MFARLPCSRARSPILILSSFALCCMCLRTQAFIVTHKRIKKQKQILLFIKLLMAIWCAIHTQVDAILHHMLCNRSTNSSFWFAWFSSLLFLFIVKLTSHLLHMFRAAAVAADGGCIDSCNTQDTPWKIHRRHEACISNRACTIRFCDCILNADDAFEFSFENLLR